MSDYKPWKDVADGFMREHDRVQKDIRELYEKMNQNRIEIAFMKGKIIAYGVAAGTIVSIVSTVIMHLIFGN